MVGKSHCNILLIMPASHAQTVTDRGLSDHVTDRGLSVGTCAEEKASDLNMSDRLRDRPRSEAFFRQCDRHGSDCLTDTQTRQYEREWPALPIL